MNGHLSALFVGERLAHRRRDLVKLEGEGHERRFGNGVGYFSEQHQAGRALDQNVYGGLVACSFDQVTFAVNKHHAIRDLWGLKWMLTILGIRPLSILTPLARSSAALSLTKAS